MAEYIFIGEDRSKTAKDKNLSWQICQMDGPHLCAIQLFSALEFVRIDPTEQWFVNLWTDQGKLDRGVIEMLRQVPEQKKFLVGMGRKVQKKLDEEGIAHKKLIHPAARGEIRDPKKYQKHVRKTLLN